MKITQSQVVNLVDKVGKTFPTFGGGQTSNYNPLVNALKDQEYQFAAGVRVKNVLAFVLKELKVEIK